MLKTDPADYCIFTGNMRMTQLIPGCTYTIHFFKGPFCSAIAQSNVTLLLYCLFVVCWCNSRERIPTESLKYLGQTGTQVRTSVLWAKTCSHFSQFPFHYCVVQEVFVCLYMYILYFYILKNCQYIIYHLNSFITCCIFKFLHLCISILNISIFLSFIFTKLCHPAF